MMKLIVSASILVVASFPNGCHSSGVLSSGPEITVTKCMLGPFKNTAMNCFRMHSKVNSCILEGLDWFHEGGTLCRRRVQNSFFEYLQQPHMRQNLIALLNVCIGRANTIGNRIKERTAAIFVRCLNRSNAFADFFPRAFCNKEHNMISNDFVEPEEANSDTSSVEVSSTNNSSHNCTWGPLEKNAERCIDYEGHLRSCLVHNLGYFTNTGRVNTTRLITSMSPHIVNAEYMDLLGDIMQRCANHANAKGSTEEEIADVLVACWMKINVRSVFKAAFCAKRQNFRTPQMPTNSVPSTISDNHDDLIKYTPSMSDYGLATNKLS